MGQLPDMEARCDISSHRPNGRVPTRTGHDNKWHCYPIDIPNVSLLEHHASNIPNMSLLEHHASKSNIKVLATGCDIPSKHNPPCAPRIGHMNQELKVG